MPPASMASRTAVWPCLRTASRSAPARAATKALKRPVQKPSTAGTGGLFCCCQCGGCGESRKAMYSVRWATTTRGLRTKLGSLASGCQPALVIMLVPVRSHSPMATSICFASSTTAYRGNAVTNASQQSGRESIAPVIHSCMGVPQTLPRNSLSVSALRVRNCGPKRRSVSVPALVWPGMAKACGLQFVMVGTCQTKTRLIRLDSRLNGAC
jgi:hypothetical protein